ncbi:MAG: MoaD/ThiS family protein [Anaerolineae bacterium]|nr:MoaD/ThiS family protein [Anaerolineae bacterium]MCI0611225.1 MoaD/ThiS family protein [Anaerolineae bacterium]
MPIIRLPNVMSFYTEKQIQFPVSASTAIEAVHAAVEKYPALKMHVLDGKGNLRGHIHLFVNNVSIRDLSGLETPVGENDVVRILPAAAGG